MNEFLFSLDATATPQRVAVVQDGLDRRFPSVRFTLSVVPNEDLENSIIPLVGQPHPTDPDAVIVRVPDPSLVREVREVFAGLLIEAKAARPS